MIRGAIENNISPSILTVSQGELLRVADLRSVRPFKLTQSPPNCLLALSLYPVILIQRSIEPAWQSTDC